MVNATKKHLLDKNAESKVKKHSSSNKEFYMSSSDKDKIMSPLSFSKEIREFLNDEEKHLRKMFFEEKYDCIIEVGCHAGHNSEWISEYCKQYIGIDINTAAIDYAKNKHIKSTNIEFICQPAEELIKMIKDTEDNTPRKLVLFPFNLFGNFVNVVDILAMLDEAGVDVAISNLGTSSATTMGRYNYYNNCFTESSIRVYDAEQGVLFKAGQDFQSIAYDIKYLQKLLHTMSDYHSVLTPFSLYGYLFTLTK